MKKVITGLLIILLSAYAPIGYAEGPIAEARSYWLYETATGQILAEHEPHKATAAASLTKLMTCLLTLEAIGGHDIQWTDTVTVPSAYINPGGSSMDLRPGEKITVRQLLSGLMIVSANDSAQILAWRIGGSESAFVKRMNVRAKELGMLETTFMNATGLPEKNGQNITSAADMGLLSVHLLKFYKAPLLGITGQRLLTDPERNYAKPTTNTLMYLKKGVDGLKTGHTDSAGYCLAATMPFKTVSDARLVAVVMGTRNEKFRDEAARKLLNWADENYDFAVLIDEKSHYPAGNWNGLESQPVEGHPESSVKKLIRTEAREPVKVVPLLPKQLPLHKGDVIGTVTARLPDGESVTIPLISDTEITQLTLRERLELLMRMVSAWFASVLPS